MNTVAKNIRSLLLARDLSAAALAASCGINQPTIHRILSGESNDPRTATLDPIARFFGVSVSDLRERDLTGAYSTDAPKVAESVLKVSVLAKSNNIISTVSFMERASSWFKGKNISAGNVICVAAEDMSNAEYIMPGDFVFFNTADTSLKSGNIYLLEYPDGLRIRRLSFTMDNNIIVSSLSSNKTRFPDEIVSNTSLVKIIGCFISREG